MQFRRTDPDWDKATAEQTDIHLLYLVYISRVYNLNWTQVLQNTSGVTQDFKTTIKKSQNQFFENFSNIIINGCTKETSKKWQKRSVPPQKRLLGFFNYTVLPSYYQQTWVCLQIWSLFKLWFRLKKWTRSQKWPRLQKWSGLQIIREPMRSLSTLVKTYSFHHCQ